jgi:2-amino-4-hydroxy-6-hydroxymethyldihydropteridine diphosphokinase
MHTYYLSLGSNLGDREGFLAKAIAGIRGVGRVIACSSVYETDPVGYLDQPSFLNMALALETESAPADLLARLESIEAEVGAKSALRNGPREIDVDILLWSGGNVDAPDLAIPHARMMERAFMLIPLAELAPDTMLPSRGTACEAAARVGGCGVRLYSPPLLEVEV